ncbi:3-hydroxyacyl-CoA dehydrogenase [Halioglobus japonicus]|uniref:3-hydroxyacyl-CoA dehydrogenase n=1 Tax=Halioglobus japonicus TaxID=930805 RepID=A0AAP8MDF9_9GAMM|nr:3-hydroxyacyl-CoA dehydrogenase NAD-binding domain-containing protein [Halioglobus japonicus]AQA17791.1 3-hydroxyacyl-CoA dehydrogenase [Halioglobus japonicus]PLW85746.1 3-hydroxyacyl-CoA dehydrogenase [Halioglobus japonicus]GHD17298.1 3-hydroxyacyl-CoA dehydrogenase [Halioglobus japonicus]
MSYIRLEKDADGIVDLIFDQEGKSVNVMGEEYAEAMPKALDELEAMGDELKGLYIRSGKPGQFFAGGDITMMLEMDLNPSQEEREEMHRGLLDAKEPLARIERLGVPVAVGINGPALGGGYEIALACHYRIAMDSPKVKVGLPEAMLGLLPGAGGIVRMTRMLGMQEALGLISQGKQLVAAKALEKGLIHELAADEEAMAAQAKAWIKANPDARQPWEQPGYSIPGGGPQDEATQGLTYFGPVNVMNQTKGNMTAPQVIIAAVIDTARVDYATAHKIEARYFQRLLLDQVSRNMMTTFFIQMNALDAGASRPEGIAKTEVKKLGILGAGVMGAGIAFNAAKVGMNVVLKDLTQENADKGKAYAASACEKSRRIDEQQAEEILGRIQPTADVADLADCDLVIEAVFENRDVKAAVTRETEAVLGEQAVFASNTSALPITELAQASVRPQNFIGMHFFSPAERMPLVEIITGEQTSDECLAWAFDLAQKMGKKPIVVKDAPGFFTTRVIGQTITQGQRMLAEGVNPALIENGAAFNGSPMGPLETLDTISLETAYHAANQQRVDAEARGEQVEPSAESEVIRIMVEEAERVGQAKGAGFYDYDDNGKKVATWAGLKALFAKDGYKDVPYQDVKDRLLFSQVLEAIRIMEEGVLTSVGDGNIGSIMGIGFPPHTGGVYQCVNAYGVQAFADRAKELAAAYGEAFEPPQLLLDMAADGRTFG